MKNSEGDERERSKRQENRGKKQERRYFLDVKTRPGIFDFFLINMDLGAYVYFN